MKLLDWKFVRWTLPPAFAMLIACIGMSQEKGQKAGEGVIKSINDVPAAVRDAATKVCGADIKKISKENEEGDMLYEFEFSKDGVESSATFSEQGALCELEHVVDAAKLPKAMIADIQKRFPGAVIQKAESTEVHGFEVHVKVGNKTMGIEASATGRLAGGEEGDEGDEGDEHEGAKR